MKRNSILILGVVSIIILVSLQFYIIQGVLKQKDEMFDLRYKVLSKEAIDNITLNYGTNGFDTVIYLINDFSARQINRGLFLIKDTAQISQKKKEILNYAKVGLNREEDLSDYLSSYFGSQGYEKSFITTIEISSFEIIDFNKKFTVYSGENNPKQITTTAHNNQSRILVGSYFFEENEIRLKFDYYIDFSDKYKLILKESSVTLALSNISILVVVIIFLTAYKNLMEEKRLSNLKTDFINNMTHELKTPLATITVAGKTLEMAQIRSNDAKILETAKLIGKQSIHLNQLINLILEISMWERTQFELDRKIVDADELLGDIADCFRAGLSNGAEIRQDFQLEGIKVSVDMVYFTTMINNLLSNAVKYSDKKPVIVLEGLTENKNFIIKVIDNGIGIAKADQKHIFDKFYRVTHGNIHKFKGLGLGLYYVKRIAEAHGGNVAVSSRPGKGTTFTINIPY